MAFATGDYLSLRGLVFRERVTLQWICCLDVTIKDVVSSQFYSRVKELNYFAAVLASSQLYCKRRHYYFHRNSSCVIILWPNVGRHNGLDLPDAVGNIYENHKEISSLKWGKEFIKYQRNNSFPIRKFSVELLRTRTVYIIRHICGLYITKLKNVTCNICVTIKICGRSVQQYTVHPLLHLIQLRHTCIFFHLFMNLAFFPHSYQCVKGTRISGMKNKMHAVSSILSPKELLSCIKRLYLSCITNSVRAVTRPTTFAEYSFMGKNIFISISPQKQTHGNHIAQHLPYRFVWIKWTQEGHPYLYNQYLCSSQKLLEEFQS